MKPAVRLIFLGLLAASFARAGDAWRRSKDWDDGRAEFSVYAARWKRYGAIHEGRVLAVLVKEPWAPDLDVKADRPRADGFDVLKFNWIRDVPTGIYTYNQTVSAYLRRDDLALVKLAAASTEACGVSSADMTRGTLRTRSYFDGEGDRAQPWSAAAVAEDALPVRLRDFAAGAVPEKLDVFPTLLVNRYADLAPASYRLTRRRSAPVKVPAGEFVGLEFRLTRGKAWRSYVLEAAAPHRLLRYAADDGTTYELARSERISYWKMHAPGDEAWLPPGLR